MNLLEILNRSEFSKDEILYLLSLENQDELTLLFSKARAVKQLYLGRFRNKIASIQFSNNCENNCLYCELREDNISTKRFRMQPDEILQKIKIIVGNNINNIILQSGSDSFYDTDMIAYLIYKIKKEHDILITLNLLQRGFDEYRAWKFAGADNYLLKFNTSNKDNFSVFNRDNKLEDRINHIKYLKRIGYEVCTGNIVGLPNQSLEDIASDLLILKQFAPEMICNTPFVPHYFPRFKHVPKIELSLMMKIISITRLLQKKSDIIISDSNDFFNVNQKKELFEVGANTLLLEYSGNNNLNKEDFYKFEPRNISSKGKIVN